MTLKRTKLPAVTPEEAAKMEPIAMLEIRGLGKFAVIGSASARDLARREAEQGPPAGTRFDA